MVQKIGRRNFKIKAMDIESHNDSESIKNKETSMWLGCYIDETSKIEQNESFFYSMEDFIDLIEKDSKNARNKAKTRLCKNVCVYIYNLSFEWSFLLPVLLKRGYTFKSEIEETDSYVFNTISTKSVSSVWEVNIKAKASYGFIKLRDLSKIFGGGLGTVAKSFGLETQKGEIDYRLNRLHNHVITKEEYDYCFRDTRIIIDILLRLTEDKDFWNSISMASYSMRKLIKRGYPRKLKPYKAFREEYPELSFEENNFLRKGVEGGICYAPVDYQFKVIDKKICHIDAHQMHPSSAYLNFFPYGKGEYFIGRPPLDKICCCRIRISYDAVKLHSIIKLIGLPFIDGREITVWDFEIPVMYDCYINLEVEYIDGYAYKRKVLTWRQYYADNYRLRLEAKKNQNAFLVLYYKLLNNSSYGKLLEKPHNSIFQNIIGFDGIIDSIETEKPEDEWKANAKYTYIPVGSCIPAYSRVALIRLALKIGWEKVLYFDTDSIFFLWDEESEKVWNETNQTDFLGGWGLEEFIDKAQFVTPKRYKTITNGELTVKAGGINFHEWLNDYALVHDLQSINMREVPFDEINIVNSSFRVQRAFRVKGGTIIEFQTKEVNVPRKYSTVYESNVTPNTVPGDDS